MRLLKDFAQGDELSRQYINEIVRAVRELQTLAVEHVEYPLKRDGTTLSALAPIRQKFYTIISNEGAGEYVVTRVEWDATEHEFVAIEDENDPEFEVEAWDLDSATTGRVDDIVPGCMVLGSDGAWRLIIQIPSTSTFPARITGSTSIGENRWSYTFAEVEYLREGQWSTVADGITGTAYNLIEASNTGAGVQGCGINVDWLPAGVALKPIGTGAVVELRKRINCETFETEYTFAASNLPDGQCED